MNLLTILVIIGVCLFHEVTQTFADDKDNVKLTVLYESKCPDCEMFIVNLLYTTWKEFKFHIKLDLVPYGKAQELHKGGHVVFNCQHGPEECVGNILHACAIQQACGGHGTLKCPADQLAKALDYITCVMQQPDQQVASDQCASRAGLQPEVISKCANGEMGESLMVFNGHKTKHWSDTPEFHTVGVPFIVINGSYSVEENEAARQDLRSVICKYIPDQCS